MLKKIVTAEIKASDLLVKDTEVGEVNKEENKEKVDDKETESKSTN